jgi:hypothetical protein
MFGFSGKKEVEGVIRGGVEGWEIIINGGWGLRRRESR